MKVSYKWLQTYFDEKIPTPEKLADLFTFRAFEVEGVEPYGSDFVIDIKILPDRAHYALCHKGIAEEVSVITGIPCKKKELSDLVVSSTRPLIITVADSSFCPRYTGRVVESVTVTDSPQFIKEALEAIGARSINNIVDATNYVMFNSGQPLHAFDADKVKGAIHVRAAREGETIITLDGKEIKLSPLDSVIADDEAALAIAGIKGGKKAEVTKETKNIIIESANFHPTQVRKTSTKVGIRNESSKRYENAITPELTLDAMKEVSCLIAGSCTNAKFGPIVDVYPAPVKPQVITTTAEYISQRLGLALTEEHIISTLTKFGIQVTKKDASLILTIPFHRLDLTSPDDLVEEVGRIYGYENITPTLPGKSSFSYNIHKTFYYSEKIKNILRDSGFSEVYLYALTNKGHHEVAYPLASDKSFLRTEITTLLSRALDLNASNSPLLNLTKIKLFEIGKVFTDKGEHTSLVVGVKFTKKFKGETVNDEIKNVREYLLSHLDTKITTLCTIDDTGGLLMMGKEQVGIINNTDGVMELNLDKIIAVLPEPTTWDIPYEPLKDVKYAPISVYPFVLRDIAVFVPEGTTAEQVLSVITKNAGNLLARHELFDVFKKEINGLPKLSYAYHLVFLSHERTLTDTDVHPPMEAITKEMTALGWQVR